MSRQINGEKIAFSTNGAQTTELGNGYLDMTPKAQAAKQTRLHQNWKCASKYTIQNVKGKHTKWRSICKLYLIMDLYLHHIKNTYNSVVKRQIA